MIAKHFLALVSLATTSSYILASQAITIHNHTLHPIYAATYHSLKTLCGRSIGPAERQGEASLIEPYTTSHIDRPAFNLLRNRELLLSIRQADLKEGLSADEFIEASRLPIGRLKASTYHVDEEENTIKGYSQLAWQFGNPIRQKLHELTDTLITSLRQEYDSYPYAHTDAQVIYDASLSPEEIAAVTNRRARACKAVSRIAETPVTQDDVPCSVVCFSGGGMRAANCAERFDKALKKIKLRKTITHYVALSGSTWFLNHLLCYSGPRKQYHEHFMQALTQPHLFPPHALTRQLLRKVLFGQDTSIVDLYSIFLAHTFFADEGNPETKLLSAPAQLDAIQSGRLPFPISTAVETSAENHWLEFTPYGVRSTSLNFRMPTWAFGRKFVNGTSTDRAPELPAGFFMAMSGSALSGSLADQFSSIGASIDNPIIKSAIRAVLRNTDLAEVRPAAIRIHNPLYGIDASPHRNIEQFIVMDAGYSSNNPIVPALDRHADIIYILDVSENVCTNHDELKKAEDLAHQRGRLFPPIDYEKIGNNPVTIFTDPQNPACPAVAYIFPTKDAAYDPNFDPKELFIKKYSSARFVYTREDAEKMGGLIEFILITHKEQLYELVKQKTLQKQQRRTAQQS